MDIGNRFNWCILESQKLGEKSIYETLRCTCNTWIDRDGDVWYPKNTSSCKRCSYKFPCWKLDYIARLQKQLLDNNIIPVH